MATNYYEGMFLLDSAEYASDPDGMDRMLTEAVEKVDGNVVAHRPWQDGRLAYEIEGRRKGLHFLMMFTLEGTRMGDLQRACRMNDKILRTMFLSHPKVLFDATVEAINPQPVEGETEGETAETPAAAETE